MKRATEHIAKAHALLAEARYLQAGGFIPGAGRGAYLAGFHAALALIVVAIGKEPKTHTGTRSEFARLTRDDTRIDPTFIRFLGRGYDLKEWADYDDDQPMTVEEVVAMVGQATHMVETIERLLSTLGPPPA